MRSGKSGSAAPPLKLTLPLPAAVLMPASALPVLLLAAPVIQLPLALLAMVNAVCAAVEMLGNCWHHHHHHVLRQPHILQVPHDSCTQSSPALLCWLHKLAAGGSP